MAPRISEVIAYNSYLLLKAHKGRFASNSYSFLNIRIVIASDSYRSEKTPLNFEVTLPTFPTDHFYHRVPHYFNFPIMDAPPLVPLVHSSTGPLCQLAN
jgi:hypothetical protein